MIKKLMMLVVGGVLSAALPLAAATETVDGITWTYTVANGVASVGGGSSSSPAVPKTTSGSITIPSELGGYSVTSIGTDAFYDCSGLTSVTIPESVTNIGNSAFSRCIGLTNVTIPNSVKSIGRDAFSACTNLTSMTIPESVTSIGSEVLYDCSNLTNLIVLAGTISDCAFSQLGNGEYDCGIPLTVTIGNSVTNIGDSAFECCDRLTSVTIPESVKSVGPYAFRSCNNLTNIVVHAGTIGYNAFGYCGTWAWDDKKFPLTLTIGSSVTNIEDYAFSFCRGICDLTIPANVATIGYNAFEDTSVTNLYIDVEYAGNVGRFGLDTGVPLTVVLGDNVKHVGDGFLSHTAIDSLTLGTNIETIGEMAFYECWGLTNVKIPDSVRDIGDFVFTGDGYDLALTNITIGCGVTNIGYAFAGCRGLTSVTIPSSVQNIGDYAFSLCNTLSNIVFEGNAPNLGKSCFTSENPACTVYVKAGSTGWGVDIPGTWNGLNIQYLPLDVEIAAANEAGGGTVELDVGELADVEVASGVTLVVKGENLDAAALAAKITPKPHEVGQSASLFKVKAEAVAGGMSLSVVLDEEAVDPDETAGEIVDAANMAAFSAAAEGENVSVSLLSAKQGLYYGIAAANNLVGLDEAAANVPLVRAGADGIAVPVAKPFGGSAFFKVIVSDRAR